MTLLWGVVMLCVMAAPLGLAMAADTPEALRARSALPVLAPNRPGLDLPIADRKLVMAHYMTGMLPTPAAETERWMNPALYDPHGPTAAIGGEFQTLPIPVLLHPDLLPPEEAALLEMRTAMKLGVDGFNFYYPFGPNEAFRDRYDRLILAFFDAAREHDLDFKLTLCFCAADGTAMTTREKIDTWGARLRGLIEATRGSDHWLKTPDGRILFYTWIADGMADEFLGGKQWEIREHPDLLEAVAASFEAIADRAGVRGAFLYHLQFPGDPAFVDKALDYFPAVTGWCNVEDLDAWRRVAAQCRRRDRTYVQEVHGDYYTSKVFPRGEYGLVFDVDRVVELGPDRIERHAQVLGLTRTFRDKLQMAVDLDTPLINLTTWNDYPEGHHLAPEINHNFGFSLLLRHYKALWRGEPGQGPSDVAMVFFKKYPSTIEPDPFDIAVRYKQKLGEPAIEDFIEVVTILASPGVVRINDLSPREAPAGLSVMRVPMSPGPVRVTVTRDGAVVAQLETPEWITLEPYRTDRLTYSYSSRHDAIYRALYGKGAPMHTSMEYAEDAHGVPQWQRGVRTRMDGER